MKIRLMEENDYDAFKNLFDQAYSEYLDLLRQTNHEQYFKAVNDKMAVTRARFEFYLNTGISLVLEADGEIIGYVACQTVRFMHGVERLLWIEYVTVKREFRRRGLGTALLKRLIDYAQKEGIERIYTTINPDNESSIKLHEAAGFNVKNWKIASKMVA